MDTTVAGMFHIGVTHGSRTSSHLGLCVRSLIDVAVEGTELKRIRIELTARYGSELQAVAEHVRTTAAAIVEDLLGDIAAIGDMIDVVVTEIVDGDPLTE
ncbi:hypothetical protein [Mycolicibacterium hodleri]|uniref:hypothetical protein n=1 Tax=Mycolicibacterium hodleri TaxID=49897 RepID=UPI0014768C48|nr:hypothetical protein [Mycolicibacterium hodleri]